MIVEYTRLHQGACNASKVLRSRRVFGRIGAGDENKAVQRVRQENDSRCFSSSSAQHDNFEPATCISPPTSPSSSREEHPY